MRKRRDQPLIPVACPNAVQVLPKRNKTRGRIGMPSNLARGYETARNGHIRTSLNPKDWQPWQLDARPPHAVDDENAVRQGFDRMERRFRLRK